jgi:hypothetical protein
MTTTRFGSETVGGRVRVLIGIDAGASALRMTAPIQNWQPAFSENIEDAFIRNNPRSNLNLSKSFFDD